MAASPELHFQAAGAEKNSAIKRIMSEWKGMQRDPASKYGYMAQPSEVSQTRRTRGVGLLR